MTSRFDPKVEGLFAEFLARRAAGEAVELEGLLAEHPEHADALRALWRMHRIEGESPGDFSFFGRGERLLSEEVFTSPARAGDRIGDFHLVERIARGGQGEVWLAEQASLSRKVALKLIRPERVSERAMALFAREARAGGRLTHPGIVSVHAHGVTEGHAWIAMELVEGAWTLRDSIAELSEAEKLPGDYYRLTAGLIAQVADALQAAHDAGVIHRDVKPSNILITPDDRPMLTDFGLARITDEEALSVTGDFAGTYFYMSPEQVAARRAGIDHRTDVFSLGVVAYELLSLHRPFTGESSHEVIDQILTMDPPDLRRVCKGMPRDLALICAKALAKSRRERYQSMAELAADLRNFVEGEAIRARPPSPVQRVARWGRKHPTLRAVLVTLVGVALLIVGMQVVRPVREPPPFTGEGYEQLLVASTPADERAPTFVGDRYLVYEHRPAEGGMPGLWYVDLETSLVPRAWSPGDEPAAGPAVSADGRWLAFERPGEEGASELVVRRLEATDRELVWPREDDHVLVPEAGSYAGVRWLAGSRFVYTHARAEVITLRLHDAARPEVRDVELASLPGPGEVPVVSDAANLRVVPVATEPRGGRMLYAVDHTLRTIDVGAPDRPPQVVPLDCGTVIDPLWLADGSILYALQTFRELSPRLHRLADGRIRRVEELETRLLGGWAGLATNGDRSMLALVGEVRVSKLFLAPPGGGEVGELATRYPPSHTVWTPDGRLLYAGDTARAARLFLHDPVTGGEETLEVALPELGIAADELRLDQPGFSQNGRRLAFRAKGEPLDGRCNAREWIVTCDWPPTPASTRVFEAPMSPITFPHVSDAGDRLLWVERHPEGRRLVTAEVEGARLVNLEERARDLGWPVRLSGDGERIALPRVVDGSWGIELRTWEGELLERLAAEGEGHRPMWIPGEGGAELAWFHWDPADPERWLVFGLDAQGGQHELCVLPVPERNPNHESYDPWTGRAVYGVSHVEAADIWLVRPKPGD